MRQLQSVEGIRLRLLRIKMENGRPGTLRLQPGVASLARAFAAIQQNNIPFFLLASRLETYLDGSCNDG